MRARNLEVFRARSDGALWSMASGRFPAHSREIGTGWSLRALPTQTFCDSACGTEAVQGHIHTQIAVGPVLWLSFFSMHVLWAWNHRWTGFFSRLTFLTEKGQLISNDLKSITKIKISDGSDFFPVLLQFQSAAAPFWFRYRVSASSHLSQLDEEEQGFTIATIREVIAITRLLQEIELSGEECMSDWITSYILHRTSIKILWLRKAVLD